MDEPVSDIEYPLLSELDSLFNRVKSNPLQPLNLLTEEAVLHWTRVLDGQDMVQPRLNEQGYAPTAFHYGMEPRSTNQLDDCGLGNGPEHFEAESEKRLADLAAALEEYFGGSGYRASSDQCDRMTLEMSRCSRFFNAWAEMGERSHRRRRRGRKTKTHDKVNIYSPGGEDSFLTRVRRGLALWEPFFNAAIISWEENHLVPFDRAMEDLRFLLGQSPSKRLASLPSPGFPLRRRGLQRQKVSVFEPEQRPLRSRSVLQVRYLQLRDRLLQGTSVDGGLMTELAENVAHFSSMVTTNLFMLGSTPGFFMRGRPGVPIIRGRPSHHPFLLDAPGFFKKAVLFHNGTYSAAGGALDSMFLNLRQLERMCRFQRWGDWARPLRVPIENAVIAWEENRWDAFTEGLLEVAEILRGEPE